MARSILAVMDRTVGWISEGVRVDSVVVDGVEARHVYRIVGGADDGREFDTLQQVSGYLAEQSESSN